MKFALWLLCEIPLLVMPSSALASPQFEGRSGEELGQHLAHCLTQLYSSQECLDLESLIIVPGQQCWVLFVDALVSDDGWAA